MSYKSKGSYGTGLKECGPKCICIICKRRTKMDVRKLINVKMKDGSVKAILNVTEDTIDKEMELVENDEGNFEIRIKTS